MKKIYTILTIVGLLVVASLLVIFSSSFSNKDDGNNNIVKKDQISDPKNATYIIEGKSVTLVNGYSQVPAAPGSASKITTKYFGNEVTHDFD